MYQLDTNVNVRIGDSVPSNGTNIKKMFISQAFWSIPSDYTKLINGDYYTKCKITQWMPNQTVDMPLFELQRFD
jgi:hypothetical protein